MSIIHKKLESVFNTYITSKFINLTFEDDTMEENSVDLSYELGSLFSIWRLKENLKNHKLVYCVITVLNDTNFAGYVDILENEVQYFDEQFSTPFLIETNVNPLTDFKICSLIEYFSIFVIIKNNKL